MQIVTLIGIGFSIVSAMILLLTYLFFLNNVNKSWVAVVACVLLLSGLIGLQWHHLQFFLHGGVLFESWTYRLLLSAIPPVFFLFSRAILLPGAGNPPWLFINGLPLLINVIPAYQIAIPLTFVVGTFYTLWFAVLIYSLKAQRQRFHLEIFFFSFFAIVAVLVLLMGISILYIDPWYFYAFYSSSIALAFVLVVTALMVFPNLLSELAVVSSLSYANSTLKGIDISQALERLEQVVVTEGLYQNENINLAMVAQTIEMTSHQLSELINVHYGMSFSRYIRQQRVEAAKKLLKREPDASILAISLETGFKSQSNFYAAFKEVTGQSPGDYRRS